MEIFDDDLNVDVIGFGALNVDKLYSVDQIASNDEECSILDTNISPGGSASNTIIALSKLNVPVSYIGKIGDDSEGELLEYTLAENNVFLNNLIYGVGSSGKVLGFVDTQGNRALYVDGGVNEDISMGEINPIIINQAKIIHITSMFSKAMETQIELMDKLNDKIIVSFDPGMIYAKQGVEAILKILKRTNILLINEAELKILFDDYYSNGEELSFRDIALRLLDDGIETVIVKRGTKGVYGINKDEEVKIPIFKVKAIDTTCAGDSFNGGFLYSYLKGYSLEKSCTIGNWLASKSVEGLGISALPTIDDLKEFEKEYDKE